MKITRRKLFGLVAGAAIAPKELLAAPAATGAITLEMLQKAYAAATFAGPAPNLMAYPMTPEECFTTNRPTRFIHISEIGHWPC